jgi:hypothetical protein
MRIGLVAACHSRWLGFGLAEGPNYITNQREYEGSVRFLSSEASIEQLRTSSVAVETSQIGTSGPCGSRLISKS